MKEAMVAVQAISQLPLYRPTLHLSLPAVHSRADWCEVHQWASSPSHFQLDLANRKPRLKMRGREERELGYLTHQLSPCGEAMG